MRITEEVGIFWKKLQPYQKAIVIGVAAIVFLAVLSGWISSYSAWRETRALQRDVIAAKRDAKTALENAVKIAAQKLVIEKQIVEIEGKRDGKITEAEQANLNTLDARDEYYRSKRQSRGDNPSAEQLCGELAALGYSC